MIWIIYNSIIVKLLIFVDTITEKFKIKKMGRDENQARKSKIVSEAQKTTFKFEFISYLD